MTTPLLVIASRNVKKVGEIAELLAPRGVDVRSVSEFDGVPDVVEDGTTFGENAALKATQTARILGQWALGEDSGLCVDALDGEPGIYSARFSGEEATDQANNQLLIERLADVPSTRRGAHYVCHVAVSDPEGGVRLSVEANCHGRIVDQPRGENGFGYDPHFLLPEYHRTFGELAAVVKRHLSHRARAFERLIPELVGILGG
ncbi:MAG: non-canonical purine NTP pyrophosphatase, RdgB/HAM1 family [Planctomycetaceae bacterium]|nr:non-canonical purine NTP pyrophosphatase, RdgB/HAM1 family [Planctomycetaceae bacterium]